MALVGLAIFFWLIRVQEGRWVVPLAISGFVQFLVILIFAYNILRTKKGQPSA